MLFDSSYSIQRKETKIMNKIENRTTVKLFIVLILSFLFCVTTVYLKKDDFRSHVNNHETGQRTANLPD
jgi:hypothetical protein